MSLSITATIKNNDTSESLSVTNLSVSTANSYEQSGTINIGTTEETLTLQADFTNPGYVYFLNLDDVHSVQIGSGMVLTGDHTGAADASSLTDSKASFPVNGLIGFVISNDTDGSTGTITANTATNVTATLAGGTENDWDVNDEYSISSYWSALRPGYPLLVPMDPSVVQFRLKAASGAVNGVDVHYKIFNTA